MGSVVVLTFRGGTLELRGLQGNELAGDLSSLCRWDSREACHRARAVDYAPLVLGLRAAGREIEDLARGYDAHPWRLRTPHRIRPFQREALEAWQHARRRGVVVLPTGAGKTYLALSAIEQAQRSTLVVAPTLDLVRQWYDALRDGFDTAPAIIGGGEYGLAPLTVTTYDSAYLHMEHLGHRFGLVVYDECHHLPGEAYALAAQCCLAPFRLGLTATPERTDGRERELYDLIGPTVYRRDVDQLSGDYLAHYRTERLAVELGPEDQALYERERAIYRAFVRSQGIRMNSPRGWSDFLMRACRSHEGLRALEAYQTQRRLALRAPRKMNRLEALLEQHRQDRVIVFTHDNQTAYEIARRFLIPVITHRTHVTERSEILQRFREGTYGTVVTSRVLNEGVDVPEANVAIVVSGTGSVREHVQRLGRVLRKKQDKQAILYELVTADTGELYTSDRRRSHVAYR